MAGPNYPHPHLFCSKPVRHCFYCFLFDCGRAKAAPARQVPRHPPQLCRRAPHPLRLKPPQLLRSTSAAFSSRQEQGRSPRLLIIRPFSSGDTRILVRRSKKTLVQKLQYRPAGPATALFTTLKKAKTSVSFNREVLAAPREDRHRGFVRWPLSSRRRSRDALAASNADRRSACPLSWFR